MFSNIFKQAEPDQLTENFFRAIDREWMLVTAGKIDDYNTMTASWGTTGILWNKNVAICFVRPSRYTFEFVEKSNFYTLSFFNDKYHDALNYCGSHTGRKVNKAAATGLKPIETPGGSISFEQSRLILECRTLYADFINRENFIDEGLINLHYRKSDFHKFFIAEITGCWECRNP